MTNNEEIIKNYLNFRNDIKEQTKQTYYNSFYRLLKILDTKADIFKLSQKTILNKLEKLEPHKKVPLLQILKLISEFYNKRMNLIESSLLENKEKLLKAKNKEVKELLNINELKYNDIIKILNNPKNDQHYIVLYLLLNASTRNADLIIKYVKNKAMTDDKNFNYIYIEDDKIIYIRNIYKMAKTYGQKINVFKNKKLLEILKKKKFNSYILINSKGKPYNHDAINKYIISIFKKYNRAYKNVNQQLIYKIVLNHFENLQDYKRIQAIQNNRGHSANCSNSYYSTKGNRERREEITKIEPLF